MPNFRSVPQGGNARVLSVERLTTSRRDLLTLLPFRSREDETSATTTRYATALVTSHRPVSPCRQIKVINRNAIT